MISPIARLAESLAAIVTVATLFEASTVTSESPEVILPKVTITVSLDSKIVSSFTVTAIIAECSPAGMVTVPHKAL